MECTAKLARTKLDLRAELSHFSAIISIHVKPQRERERATCEPPGVVARVVKN